MGCTKIIYDLLPEKLFMGYGEEQLSRTLTFDISQMQAELPGGVPMIAYMRPRDELGYLASGVTLDGSTLTWELSAHVMQYKGIGGAQIVLVDESGEETHILKSHVMQMLIGSSIPLTGGEPPEPWETWLEQILAAAARAESAAADAEAQADRAETAEAGAQQALIDAGSPVIYGRAQTLTDAQQQTARGNIAAASAAEVSDLKSAFFNNAYSENLCGTTALELYPVALKQNSYITVSTSDGSVFPSSPIIRFRVYDANKTMIDYYSLSAGKTSRTIKLSADVYYLTIDGTMANPFMVNVGRSVAPYVPYFPGVKKLKELIDKNATDITAINNELDILKNTYFKCGRPYLGNNSLLNPTNITGGIYSFGPTNQNSDYPDDWEGTLYGALFYFNNVDIIIRQAGTANVWLKANNSTWITLHNSYGVVELNKDKDALIQQIKYGRPTLLGTDHLLSFIHFSDVHAKLANWNRVLKFANAYADFFAFVIHTGDYVRNDQSNAVDLYGDGIACDLPVLNTVGNHDIYTDFASRTVAPIATTRSIIFPDDTTGWGVTFGPSTDAMYYYKDFPTEKVRLVVLDEYYNLAEQTTWLADILADAKSNGYHVLTATHEVTKPITLFSDNTFCAYDAEELTVAGLNHSSSPFDAVIKTFKDGGGVHIANLCGHEHVDMMGKTDAGIFNIVIGTSFELTADASDANRVNNTVTQDLFNCVGINTNTGVIKLIRIGCDTDHYLRSRKTLAYNYLNDVLIANT